MSQEIINISSPDDGLGDVLRNGFNKTNQNFTELYNNKVDKVAGKGLSENDFTDADKSKLDGIEAGAQVNIQSDFGETDPLEPSFILNKPPSLYASVGYFHINDTATHTTPISLSAGVNTILTNNALGVYTNLEQSPYLVPKIWQSFYNAFDFSHLSIGDTLDLRVDLLLTTTSANQKYSVFLRIGEGSTEEYDLLVFSGQIKSISTDKQIVGEIGFSIDYQSHIDNLAHLYIVTDNNGSVKVNGWYARILRKNLNILSIQAGDNKQNIVQIVSSNITAVNNEFYHVVANATISDPTPPIEGRGFTTFVRNGTTTIGGVAYQVGSYVIRTFHSGSWESQLIGGKFLSTFA
jgi:hypothetical protein